MLGCRLECSHVTVSLGPVYGVPVLRSVGSSTNREVRCACLSCCCRHLLCLLNRFAKFSRDERPDGSLLAFARGDVTSLSSPSIPPIAGWHSLFPSSSTRMSLGASCKVPTLSGDVRASPVFRTRKRG